MRAKDRFLKRLYGEHREIWSELGRPQGFYWFPDDDPMAHLKVHTGSLKWWDVHNDEPEWLGKVPEMRDAYLAIRARVKRWNTAEW